MMMIILGCSSTMQTQQRINRRNFTGLYSVLDSTMGINFFFILLAVYTIVFNMGTFVCFCFTQSLYPGFAFFGLIVSSPCLLSFFALIRSFYSSLTLLCLEKLFGVFIGAYFAKSLQTAFFAGRFVKLISRFMYFTTRANLTIHKVTSLLASISDISLYHIKQRSAA